ncbi:MAG: hypothetical protein NTY19_40840 [Planctomycetota bacterium]|nr:hypothetical protein [Planctomycetota bacterium]
MRVSALDTPTAGGFFRKVVAAGGVDTSSFCCWDFSPDCLNAASDG